MNFIKNKVYPRLKDSIFLTKRPVYGLVMKISRERSVYPTLEDTEETNYIDEKTCRILSLFTGEKTLEKCVQIWSKENNVGYEEGKAVVEKVLQEAIQRDCVEINKEQRWTNAKIEGSFDNPTPRWATLEITDICNLKCMHCYRRYGTINKETNFIKRIKYLANILYESGIRIIDVTGGERYYTQISFR